MAQRNRIVIPKPTRPRAALSLTRPVSISAAPRTLWPCRPNAMCCAQPFDPVTRCVCCARCRASVDEIAKSLQDNWRTEHLFTLKQALPPFDFIGTQLTECNQELQAQLASLHAHEGSPATGKKRGHSRNAPHFNLREHLFKVCGVDLTRISGKTKRVVNRAAQALRLAAAALRTSQSASGAYFRRMCERMDKPQAVTAAAHKLARLIYTLLTNSQEYTDQGQDYFEER